MPPTRPQYLLKARFSSFLASTGIALCGLVYIEIFYMRAFLFMIAQRTTHSLHSAKDSSFELGGTPAIHILMASSARSGNIYVAAQHHLLHLKAIKYKSI